MSLWNERTTVPYADAWSDSDLGAATPWEWNSSFALAPGIRSIREAVHVGEANIDIEELYRTYGPMVVRRCRWMLRDGDAARDATQDVFVQLLRRPGLVLQHPSTLLYRIATNVCLNSLRARGRRPEDPEGDLLQRIAAADEEGRFEARSILDRVFGRERESTRTIAVLHLLDGFTLKEVADLTGMSVSGVRKRLRSLKDRVRELEETP